MTDAMGVRTDRMAQVVKEGQRLCRVGLCLLLSGCTSLPGVSELKQLPGFMDTPPQEEIQYDKTVLAYRVGGTDASKGSVLRNAVGKKIQTAQELKRFTSSVNREIVGVATRYTAYTLAGLYTPYNVATKVFYIVPTVPLFVAGTVLKSAREEAVETAYGSGRTHFMRGELKEALADWSRAIALEPELRAISDLDYWRGRAFQEDGKVTEAVIAYQLFLSYSERTRPDFFTKKFPADMRWEEEAADIERRLSEVQNSSNGKVGM